VTRTIRLEDPVGRLASQYPELTGVMDRLGLDYCCHGQDSLRTACLSAGKAEDDVLAELQNAEASADASEPDCASMSMTQLADHIEQTHHAKARELFALLDQFLPKMARKHGDAEPRLIELAEVVRVLKEDMHDHFVREERVLFPWIRRLETPGAIHIGPPWSVQRPISCMEHDHTEVGRTFEKIKTLTAGYSCPSGACQTYRRAFDALAELEHGTRRHVHKENNMLFPAAVRAEAARAGSGGGLPAN